MIPIIPTILATKASLDMLQKAKAWFYPSKTLNEAEEILAKRVANDVESLQQQIQTHRQVMDKLVEQVKADKDMIEKHNEVLIQLSETMQEVGATLSKLRVTCYWALGLAGVSLCAAIILKFLK